LKEKIASGRSPVSKYFEEYTGPDDNYGAVVEFFQDLFLMKNPNPEDRKIYSYVTCATDSKNIEVVDVTVQRIIMDEIFVNIGMN
jgi:guanine nucleotide-binding protein G(i) subunit alpha